MREQKEPSVVIKPKQRQNKIRLHYLNYAVYEILYTGSYRYLAYISQCFIGNKTSTTFTLFLTSFPIKIVNPLVLYEEQSFSQIPN